MSKAWTFGENLNSDEIIPGRYNITIDPLELAKNVFCEIKPEYAKNAQPGDVIVQRHSLKLPGDLAPGEYTLHVGLYSAETQKRYPLQTSGDEHPLLVTVRAASR